MANRFNIRNCVQLNGRFDRSRILAVIALMLLLSSLSFHNIKPDPCPLCPNHQRLLQELNRSKKLITQVTRPNLCTFCGGCMAVCPVNGLWPLGEQSTLIGECAVCETCYYQCPAVGFSEQDAEMFLYDRTRRQDEPIGILHAAFVGRATREETQNQAQDGGVVTALLAYALDSGLIDATVVAGRDSKWRAKPEVATH